MPELVKDFDALVLDLETGLRTDDLDSLTTALAQIPTSDLFRVLERFDANDRAVLFRLLPRDVEVGS